MLGEYSIFFWPIRGMKRGMIAYEPRVMVVNPFYPTDDKKDTIVHEVFEHYFLEQGLDMREEEVEAISLDYRRVHPEVDEVLDRSVKSYVEMYI